MTDDTDLIRRCNEAAANLGLAWVDLKIQGADERKRISEARACLYEAAIALRAAADCLQAREPAQTWQDFESSIRWRLKFSYDWLGALRTPERWCRLVRWPLALRHVSKR